MQPYKAFTLQYNGLAKSLKTQCGVCKGTTIDDLNNGVKPVVKTITAIWDTGAELSSISQNVAHDLGLAPVGRAKNYTAAGEIEVDVYIVNIILPMNVTVVMVPVTCNDLGDTDMLIGMDIISQGDFAVTNVDKKTTLSFRIPSVEKIDYVKEQSQPTKPIVKTQEPRRNDPCPCGSGKKYKNCCGK